MIHRVNRPVAAILAFSCVTPRGFCGALGPLTGVEDKGETCMSLSSHLNELRKKHEALSRQIEDEQRQPGSNDLVISTLKRQKLHLKDEIERISHQTVN